MPQVGVDAFYCKCVAFVVNIAHMATRINHINIANPTICAVSLRAWRAINDCLDSLWGLIKSNIKTRDLAGVSAYHRHQIDVFAGFGARFLPDKPI